jgi:hypothetical protein
MSVLFVIPKLGTIVPILGIIINRALFLGFLYGVADGDRTHDLQGHNLAL